MLRWLRLAAVCGVGRAWSGKHVSSCKSLVAVVAFLTIVAFLTAAVPAHAIVQETNTTATNTASEIKETTLTIEQPGRPTQTVKVTGTRPTTRRVRIDTDKPVTLTARSTRVDGRPEPERKRTVEGAVFLRQGVDLGGGLILTNTAVRMGSPSPTPVVPGTATPQRSLAGTNGSTVGQTGVGVDVGLTGGGSFRSSGGSRIRGVDNFLGTYLTDERQVDLGGDAGFVGGIVNVWDPAPGLRFFAQTGVNVSIDASSSARQTGLNAIPQGDATAEIKYNWEIPLFAGWSDPIPRPFAGIFPLQNTRWRIGLGGVISHGKVSIFGVDGPARLPFSASKSFTDFHPGFLVGLRGGMAGGFILGADVMFTWRDDKTITAGSASFPGTQSYTSQVDGGLDVTAMLSVSQTFGAPPPPPPPP